MGYVLKLPAIRIERRFADAILEGRKVWEFRKKPLSIDRRYLLCVAGECDRVAGMVDFSSIVGTYRGILIQTLQGGVFKPWEKYTGLPKGWLERYAKDYEIVYAHLVAGVTRLDIPHGGILRGSSLVFRSMDKTLLESIRDAINRKADAGRVTRYDMHRPASASKEPAR